MWVVQFEAKFEPRYWMDYESSYHKYKTEEEAQAALVVEIFEDPSYKYRVSEVPD